MMTVISSLTLQIWFFASEVSHYSLQLSQLAMGWVDVCLTVGPANKNKVLGFVFFCFFEPRLKPTHASIYCFPYEFSTHHSLAIVRSGASKSCRPAGP